MAELTLEWTELALKNEGPSKGEEKKEYECLYRQGLEHLCLECGKRRDLGDNLQAWGLLRSKEVEKRT